MIETATLQQMRAIAAKRMVGQKRELYRELHRQNMADPEMEDYQWLYRHGLRPVSGSAPQLQTTLAILDRAAVNSTFSTAQSIITASATPGPAYTGPVGPFSIDYFKTVGACWQQEASGVVSTTGTPTIIFGAYFGVVIGTITTVLCVTPTLTTASALANFPWYWSAFGVTRSGSGATATMLVTGILVGNIVVLGSTVAGQSTQFAVNATPPTAVTTDLSSAVFLDLKATWGTSSSSNTITTNYYSLQSLYS